MPTPEHDPLPDIAVGRHPNFGIVAANPKQLAASNWILRGLDLHPCWPTSSVMGRAAPLGPSQAVTTCHRYLTSHLDQLHYDTALAAGRPIDTGAIEGACRHLIANRLGVTGARWGPTDDEAVLKLRALTSNDDLDTYWNLGPRPGGWAVPCGVAARTPSGDVAKAGENRTSCSCTVDKRVGLRANRRS